MLWCRYGIATPKGSKWRDPISLAILELQEKGTIQMLYNKWWKNTGDVCTRQVSAAVGRDPPPVPTLHTTQSQVSGDYL